MANTYLIKGVKGKVGGYISEDNPMPVSDIPLVDQRFDWTTGDLDYKGVSSVLGAATDTGDLWHIWKYTWAAGLPTRIQYLIGNWDSRAALDWS